MSYLLMLVILSGLILVHESGHFVCAKWAGVPVARFSMGFGPAIFKKTLGGVEYRISAIPLGGYVLLDLADENDYLNLPLAKRLIFTLGGPLANVVLAWPLYAAVNVLTGGFSMSSLMAAPLGQIWTMIGAIFAALVGLFHQSGQLMGLVGLVVEGGRHVGLDTVKALSLAAALSLNVAIFNLLTPAAPGRRQDGSGRVAPGQEGPGPVVRSGHGGRLAAGSRTDGLCHGHGRGAISGLK